MVVILKWPVSTQQAIMVPQIPHRKLTVRMGRTSDSYMRRMLLVFFSVVTAASASAGTVTPHAQIGELLITTENVEEVREIEHRLPPNKGYHFVRITGTITNVGKHAICTQISGVLETTFNLQSYASVYLDGRFNHSLHQMLPGEQAQVDFTFDVKDGVQPVTLVVKQGKKQGCSAKEPLPVYNPQARISILSIQKEKHP
jgi:hypothetical protein